MIKDTLLNFMIPGLGSDRILRLPDLHSLPVPQPERVHLFAGVGIDTVSLVDAGDNPADLFLAQEGNYSVYGMIREFGWKRMLNEVGLKTTPENFYYVFGDIVDTVSSLEQSIDSLICHYPNPTENPSSLLAFSVTKALESNPDLYSLVLTETYRQDDYREPANTYSEYLRLNGFQGELHSKDISFEEAREKFGNTPTLTYLWNLHRSGYDIGPTGIRVFEINSHKRPDFIAVP